MMKTTLRRAILAIACVLATVPAHADILINEMFVGPEDRIANDDGFGREFFELINTDGGVASLADLWLIEINGTSTDTGIVEQAIRLADAPNPNTGANGLFLWRDDASNGIDLIPNPDPQTVTHVQAFSGSAGLQTDDFGTFLLVRNYDIGAAPIGSNLDPDGNGTLDSTPWDEVLDAIGLADGTIGPDPIGDGFVYASPLGGPDLELGFGPDALSRIPSTGLWFLYEAGDGELDPDYYGPFFSTDSDEYFLESGEPVPVGVVLQYFLTPGSTNLEFVPEPSMMWLAGLGTMLLAAARRRRSTPPRET
jgi:hypothetical protein